MLFYIASAVVIFFLLRFYLQSPSSADGVIEEMENYPWLLMQSEHYIYHKEGDYKIWTANGLGSYNWYNGPSYTSFGLNGQLRFARAYKKWSRWDVKRKSQLTKA